ncbi:hypothetical protein [Deinococcus cellulosilyticus]|uniref:Uncharacterized protein n=1 Tax=Deinococcus cellulosilyticus (strain DSM 18568 / NBRC 106333 / KACC 11606 / 5516J-15) TaxID=1223518 RepID=A0A511NAC1_DEIC1|nr:hypothetical protein [Deinococcus cellulosilyticus]GEM49763.1 hypothetical protein DC3_53980 [Deinococcus cellulosilyticus NBRC 106333 = KACC 11606]
MEHHRIPTHHLYDVPREAAGRICDLADLCYQYGPRGSGYTESSLVDYAQKQFGLQVRREDHPSFWEYESALEQAILEKVAQTGLHRIYVLQFQGHPEQGWVCLIHKSNFDALQEVCRTYCLAVH